MSVTLGMDEVRLAETPFWGPITLGRELFRALSAPPRPVCFLVGKRSYARLRIDPVARRISCRRREVLQRLDVDQRRNPFLRGRVVSLFECGADFLLRAHILSARA